MKDLLRVRVAHVAVVLSALCCGAGLARAASNNELARARAALKSLGYPEARALLETALKQGGHSREELLEIYALRGEVSAVLDGAEASETEFRKLLVLDPEHAPPARDTPTFRVPFANAKKWVAAAGTFRVAHKEAQAADGTLELSEQVASDPLAMAASVEVDYRVNDNDDYTKLASESWQQAIPIRATDARYYVVVLDRFGNTLAMLGAADTPLRFGQQPLKSGQPEARPVPTEAPPIAYAHPSHAAVAAGATLIGGGVVLGVVGTALLGRYGAAVDKANDDTTHMAALVDSERAMSLKSSGYAGAALIGVGGAFVIAGAVVLIHHAVTKKR